MRASNTLRGLVRLTKEETTRLFATSQNEEALVAKPKEGKPFNLYRLTADGKALVPKYAFEELGFGEWGLPDMLDVPTEFKGTLRPFQQAAVDDLVRNLRGHGGVTLRADCGTGKTVMSLATAARLGSSTVMILVDQANIAEQWRDRIREFIGLEAEIFSGNETDLTTIRTSESRFKIVMAQSLMRYDWKDDPISADLLIVDEAHVFSAPAFSGSIANINFKLSIGLTATPDRKDGLEWVFKMILGTRSVDVKAKAMVADVLVYHLPILQDVDSDNFMYWWCPVVKKSTWADGCSGCKHYDKFPNCGGVRRASDRINMPAIIGKLTNDLDYQEWLHGVIDKLYNKKRQVLVFSQLRGHLKSLYADTCKRLGENSCGLYIGVQSKDDELRRKVAMSRPITFCSYGVANKALDVPHKDAAVFATPRADIRQAKGRIEREFHNKPTPILIDPVFDHVKLFKYMGLARRKQYRASGSHIKDLE